jgi:hypothetical protein
MSLDGLYDVVNGLKPRSRLSGRGSSSEPVTISTETVIVGGGQAGLAVSYYLGRKARDHMVLEQAANPPTLGATIGGIPSPSTRRIGSLACRARTILAPIRTASRPGTKSSPISKITPGISTCRSAMARG